MRRRTGWFTTDSDSLEPEPGKEYAPAGELVGGEWKVWIAEQGTNVAASDPVTVAARKAAPIQGPDMGPLMQAIVQ